MAGITPSTRGGTGVPGGVWRVLLGAVLLAVVAAAWFGLAGRIDWLEGWAFLVLFGGFSNGLGLWLRKANPGLLRERRRVREVEPWDRRLVRWHTAIIVALLVTAALDAGRFQASRVPIPLEIAAWAALAGSCGVIWHVFAVNAFLSSYARIQSERGHRVVTDGLYGLIRHPMYGAVIVWALALPLALGSFWALLPGAASAALLLVRTVREDRMLRERLPGYREYADRVKFRLLPGIW